MIAVLIVVSSEMDHSREFIRYKSTLCWFIVNERTHVCKYLCIDVYIRRHTLHVLNTGTSQRRCQGVCPLARGKCIRLCMYVS